jgi:outer membrane protein insertion porin family
MKDTKKKENYSCFKSIKIQRQIQNRFRKVFLPKEKGYRDARIVSDSVTFDKEKCVIYKN